MPTVSFGKMINQCDALGCERPATVSLTGMLDDPVNSYWCAEHHDERSKDRFASQLGKRKHEVDAMKPKRLTITLPGPMYETISEAAKQNSISKNQVVLRRLELWLEASTKGRRLGKERDELETSLARVTTARDDLISELRSTQGELRAVEMELDTLKKRGLWGRIFG